MSFAYINFTIYHFLLQLFVNHPIAGNPIYYLIPPFYGEFALSTGYSEQPNAFILRYPLYPASRKNTVRHVKFKFSQFNFDSVGQSTNKWTQSCLCSCLSAKIYQLHTTNDRKYLPLVLVT